MALVDKLFVSGTWQNTNARVVNGTGTPVTSVAETGSGELIADEYSLTVSAVSGGTCTVTVATSSPNNPYNGRVVINVPIDGITPSIYVIPGISLLMAVGAANGNTAVVFAGKFLGLFDSSGVDAGVPSVGLRHQVTNNSSGIAADVKARLLTQAVAVKKTGFVCQYVRQFAPGATEKTAGGGSSQTRPYVLKVVNVTGAGSGKTADLQVDGVTLAADSVTDLTTGTNQAGTALKAVNPGYGYRIILGPLSGLEFALHPSCAENDTQNILIFPSRFIQIAPDVAGSAGTYGPSDVVLTEAGQSAGVITGGGVAYYWVRVLVPLNAVAESNPHPAGVVLEANEASAAGWTL